MKTFGRGLLVAVLFGASYNLLPLPVESETHAATQQPRLCRNVKSARRSRATEVSNHAVSDSDEMSVIATAAGGPFALGNSPVEIPLSMTAATGTTDKTLAAHLKTLRKEQRIYLLLQDLSAAEQPGILYNIYLNLPSDAKPARNDSRQIGTLNFYNVIKVGGFNAADSGATAFRSYDITALAMKLQTQKLLNNRTTITITPSGTPEAGAQAMVGRVELVIQSD